MTSGDVEIVEKRFNEISAATLIVLKSLTIGPEHSAMLGDLNRLENNDYNSFYYFLIASKNNRIVGWSLVLINSDVAFYFVDPKYRRQGIGTKLFINAAQIIKRENKVNIRIPYEEGDSKFFDAMRKYVD